MSRAEQPWGGGGGGGVIAGIIYSLANGWMSLYPGDFTVFQLNDHPTLFSLFLVIGQILTRRMKKKKRAQSIKIM